MDSVEKNTHFEGINAPKCVRLCFRLSVQIFSVQSNQGCDYLILHFSGLLLSSLVNDTGSHQSLKWNNTVSLLKTISWLSFTLATAGFGFEQLFLPFSFFFELLDSVVIRSCVISLIGKGWSNICSHKDQSWSSRRHLSLELTLSTEQLTLPWGLLMFWGREWQRIWNAFLFAY